MGDANLNNLLKWSIQNSANSTSNGDAGPLSETPANTSRGLDSDMLAALLGGPSDADRMRDAMAAIQSPDVDLENKLIAFDNFELLVENIDNANNIGNLGLWMPLVAQLDSSESKLRRMAAWCIGTAVQNNEKAQERCLIVGAIPKLSSVGLHDASQATRKKAIFALSSEARNYQPGLDAILKELPKEYIPEKTLDSSDMADVDLVIDKLREAANRAS